MAVRRPEPPAPTGRVRMVLDTDTYNEIDDQFALVHTLLSPAQMDVQGIYAAPFAHADGHPAQGMEASHAEILRLFDHLNLDPAGRVCRGSSEFMGTAPRVIESAAVDHLLECALAAETPLYVVAIGAPTNVASALLKAHREGLDLTERVRVVWLGGQPFHAPSAREYNLRQDPVASHVLWTYSPSLTHIACQGVASHLLTSLGELEAHLGQLGDIGPYLLSIFRDYQRDHFGYAKEIWDLAATAYLVNPAWVPTQVVPAPRLDVDTLTWISDPDPQPVRTATMVWRNPIFQDLFRKIATHVNA